MTADLEERVRSQRGALPDLYGDVDFGIVPERLALKAEDKSALQPALADRRPALLADREAVDLIGTCTMLGDVVGDAYGLLIPEYGLKHLTAMLRTACRQGVDAVPDAPAELRAFIADMEHVPDWLDMDLVEQGARYERIFAAYFLPFVSRGATLGTFMNSYAALPMAITGALTGTRSSHRINETGSFFTSTVLPHGLDRRGPGFEAAAMVRLMHSMVRYNALRRSKTKWDVATNGIPIPQVDQMPAGMMPVYFMSLELLASGRTTFTPMERARVELSRYRCYLLGLPEELLGDTPQRIVRLMQTRSATLRASFEDSVSGALIRATMSADLRPDHSLRSTLFAAVELTWSRDFFISNFAGGDRARAAAMGVPFTRADRLRHLITKPYLMGRLAVLSTLAQQPRLRDAVDRRVVRMINKRLRDYGTPEYTTDSSTYAGASAH